MILALHIEPERLLSIAAALREQIPLVSSDAAKSMIDAAAELQRLGDQLLAFRQQQLELLKERAANCTCPVCTAERERLAAEAAPTKQSLN